MDKKSVKTASGTYASLQERWDWVISYMVVEDPFVHHILMMMDKRSSTNIDTMGVRPEGTRIILEYNNDFVRDLPTEELRGVIKHEVYHVVFHHCTHRNSEDPKSHKIHNKAADLAINSLIPDTASCRLPTGKNKGLLPKDFGFPEKLSKEQYLQLLREKEDDSENGYGDGEGGGFDAHDGWDDAAADIIKEAIRTKIQQLSKNERAWGSMPADLQQLILEAQNSYVPWEKELRYFIGQMSSSRTESTFKRPNRRFGWPYSGTKRLHVDRKCAYVDDSGSIGDDELAQFLAEINRLAEIHPVDFQVFDAQLQGPTIPFNRKNTQVQFTGRGGTAFGPVMEHAQMHHYQSIIILTDGYAEAPEYPRGVRDVLWVIIGDGKPPVDWGRVVHIPAPK